MQLFFFDFVQIRFGIPCRIFRLTFYQIAGIGQQAMKIILHLFLELRCKHLAGAEVCLLVTLRPSKKFLCWG